MKYLTPIIILTVGLLFTHFLANGDGDSFQVFILVSILLKVYDNKL